MTILPTKLISIFPQNKADFEALKVLDYNAFECAKSPENCAFILPVGLDAKKRNTEAQEHSVPILDIIDILQNDWNANTKQLRTIADCVRRFGDNVTAAALKLATEKAKKQIPQTHSVPSYPDDKFSVEIKSCYKVEFNQYLGEKKNELLDIVLQNDRLILQSGAGTGKSTWLIDLANSGAVAKLGCDHLVIVEPKTSIAEQLYNAFAENLDSEKYQKSDYYLAKGGMTNVDQSEMQDAKIIICVLDSLPKLDAIIPGCFMVVDEYHEISKDASYRGFPMFNLWRYLESVKRRILLSATPDYLFCTNLHPTLNYALIQGIHNSPNRIDLTIKIHPERTNKKHLLHYVEENRPQEKGTTIIKLDNDSVLDAYRKHCKNRKIKVDYLNSQRPGDKQKNSNYKSIMERGLLSEKLDFLLCTKLLESGVSFKFPVNLLSILDARSWQEVTQLCFRPRHNQKTGTNMINNVWLFVSDKEKDTTQKEHNSERRFYDTVIRAQDFCDRQNSGGPGSTACNSSGDLTHHTRNINGTWFVDIPAILLAIYEQSVSECSVQLLAKRIKRLDSRFSVKIEKINLVEDNCLDSILDTNKTDKEASRQAFIELLKCNHSQVIHSTCLLSKNPDFKINTKNAFRVGLMDKSEAQDFVKENPIAFAFNHKDKLLGTACKMLECGLSVNKAIQAITEMKGQDLREYKDSVLVKYRHYILQTKPKDLNGNDKVQCKIDKAIWKIFDQIRYNIVHHDKYKNGLTKERICALVNRAVKIANKTSIYRLKDAVCISRIKTLYSIHIIRVRSGKKRHTGYFLGDRKFNINRGKK